MKLMHQGAANRKVGETNMNRASSRSHSVFTMRVECRSALDNGLTHTQYGTLHMVDLAGSERVKISGANGAALTEASEINLSLTTLGRVISKVRAAAWRSSGAGAACTLRRHGYGRVRTVLGSLPALRCKPSSYWRSNCSRNTSTASAVQVVDSQRDKTRQRSHIPYRDSKLTFLLQDSLGGNAKTMVVANVSPSAACCHETLSTLQFANRVKDIRNRAKVNTDTVGDTKALQAEVERLQAELSGAQARTSPSLLCFFIKGCAGRACGTCRAPD
jgi:hypothetical protein